MYKSEGPISKTSEPPDRRPGVAEIAGGKGRRRPKKVFSAVRKGRVLLYDLLRWGTSPRTVCATQPRIAMHAHAMPPATQPAVTQASPILFGCRMHAGQVLSAEHHHDGGLRAGRVTLERSESLSLVETSLFEYPLPAKSAQYLRTALINSLAWVGR